MSLKCRILLAFLCFVEGHLGLGIMFSIFILCSLIPIFSPSVFLRSRSASWWRATLRTARTSGTTANVWALPRTIPPRANGIVRSVRRKWNSTRAVAARENIGRTSDVVWEFFQLNGLETSHFSVGNMKNYSPSCVYNLRLFLNQFSFK